MAINLTYEEKETFGRCVCRCKNDQKKTCIGEQKNGTPAHRFAQQVRAVRNFVQSTARSETENFIDTERIGHKIKVDR